MLTSRSDATTTQTGLPSDFRHQRLQHALRFNTERLGGLQADPVGIGIVVVGVQREFDTQPGERQRRAGGFGHGAIAPSSGFAGRQR
jgi:hypothetical protein